MAISYHFHRRSRARTLAASRWQRCFCLKKHEIDIMPCLPLLCDGNSHTFEMKVAGLLDNGNNTAMTSQTVGSRWYVTGKIFMWLDDATSITTGRTPTILVPAPVISVSRSLTQNSTWCQRDSVQHYLRRTFSLHFLDGNHEKYGSVIKLDTVALV